jgi:hypothetical protein
MARLVLALIVFGAVVTAGSAPASADGATAPRSSTDARISVGGPYNTDGPRREGLFHGDREVSTPEFLTLAGRPDLADRVVARRRLRLGLVATGTIFAVGGLIYGNSARDCDGSNTEPLGFDFDECVRQSERTERVGIAGVAAGGLAIGVAVLLSSRVPQIHELRRLAADHNRRLRIDPVVGADQTGLQLSGRF